MSKVDKSSVIVIGQTGSGKSTFINYITSYFRDGSADNPKIAISTNFWKATEKDLSRKESEKGGAKMQSQTTGCFTYSFTRDGKVFDIIDTPGLSDTKGEKQDDENIESISAAAANAGFLSAIVVIVNGSDSRLGGTLPDVLIDENLLLVLTNCSSVSYNFDLSWFAEKVAKPKECFFMQNSLFSTDPATWKSDSKKKKSIQRDWEDSMEVIQDFLKTIASLKATSTEAFKKMQENRNQIKSQITSLTLDVQNLNQLQEKLEAAQKGLKDTEEDRKKYENYKKKEKVKQVALVAAEFHSTLCMQHIKDNMICHENCGLEYTGGQVSAYNNNTKVHKAGHSSLSGCACMNGTSTCHVCSCGITTHFHDKKKLEQTDVEVENILHDVKAQYEQMTAAMGGLQGKVDQYSKDLNIVKTAVQDKHKQIRNLCVALKRICSRFNFVAELKSVIGIMQQSRSSVRSMDALKQLDDSIKAIEKMADDFSKSQKEEED